jgi:hypothetical protein
MPNECGFTGTLLIKGIGFRLKNDIESDESLTNEEKKELLQEVKDKFGV